MMVFLTTKSCRILYSEASEQPHRCSSHSNTLLTHMLHARSHWFLSAPGLVCCSSTLHSEFTPSAWRNQKPLLTLGEGGMQSAESRTRGLGWRGRKKKQQPPKPPRTWKTNPPRGDAACPRLSTWHRTAHSEGMMMTVVMMVMLYGPHSASNSATTNQYFVTSVFIQFLKVHWNFHPQPEGCSPNVSRQRICLGLFLTAD